jgi:hypothetical protein
MPVLVLWHRDDALFTPPRFTDPWYYLGYFRTLVDLKRDLVPDAYFGSRLSWILPGFVVHSLFAPLVANFILHVGVHSAAALSFFTILRRTVGVRAALLSTLIFSTHPWLWASTGWDYVNGAGIAYLLLALTALTIAAANPGGRLSLVLAGACFAGMWYAHFLLLSVAPILLGYYCFFAWTWRRIGWMQAAARCALWMAVGFAIVTAAFCAANYAVAGTFWFYRSSWDAALRAPQVFTAAPGLWGAHGLNSWLWFPLMAVCASLVLLPFRLRREPLPHVAPALWFAAQLLLVTAWMGYLQSRGIAMLGFYHYAAYLIPFAFLAIGALFWSGVDQMSGRVYGLLCGAAAIGLALAWYGPAPGWTLPVLPVALVSAVLTAAGLAFGRRPAGAWLALAGILVLSAQAGSQAAPHHGTRQKYRRIMDERESVERARNHDRIRFWFDETESTADEYFALSSLYVEPRIGYTFPQGGCGRVLPGTLIVVPSLRADAAELARRELSDCWSGSAMKAVVVSDDPIREGRPYTLALLRATLDLSAYRPLRAFEEPDGAEALQFAGGSDLVPLPLARWRKESPTALLENVAEGGMAVRTPRGGYEYTLAYPALTVPVNGRYRFAMRYARAAGEFAFGVFPADNSRWLAVETAGYRSGNDREIEFTVDLKAGERVVLRIANNNNYRNGRPASFRMLALTAAVAAP